MKTTKSQLKKIIPLYSDLTDLLLEFLEPCLDYDVAECTHKNAFCRCGNIFEFQTNRFGGGQNLVEKFCPFCGTANPHKSRIREDGCFFVRTKNHLRCPRCLKHAESYKHSYCSSCQHKYELI